ncbi:MAG: NAD(P)-dependent oxidoreductase [Candidatus Kapaibacteriota bacterium]|jgi:D-3-phosphoglycerate dehydrogenase
MNILITDGLAKEGKELLLSANYTITEQFYELNDLIENIGKYDAIIVRSATKVTKEVIEAGKKGNLKAVCRAGVGIDNIDSLAAKELGVPVLNTPGASAISVAELAIAMMFTLSRFLHVSTQTMANLQWNKKEYSNGTELFQKTLGVFGFGMIGKETIKRALALGMNVIVNNLIEDETDLNVKFVDKETLLSQSDFITAHIPFGKGATALIGENEIAKLKDGVILINTARGGVFDESAMLNGLKSGKIRGLGIDVFTIEPVTEAQKELLNHPNVCATPHIGGSTVEGQLRVSTEMAERLIAALS